MKRFLVILLSTLLLTGCSLTVDQDTVRSLKAAQVGYNAAREDALNSTVLSDDDLATFFQITDNIGNVVSKKTPFCIELAVENEDNSDARTLVSPSYNLELNNQTYRLHIKRYVLNDFLNNDTGLPFAAEVMSTDKIHVKSVSIHWTGKNGMKFWLEDSDADGQWDIVVCENTDSPVPENLEFVDIASSDQLASFTDAEMIWEKATASD